MGVVKKFIVVLIASFVTALPAMSASLYGIEITVYDASAPAMTATESLSFDTVEELYDAVDETELADLFETADVMYIGNDLGMGSRAEAEINYRGIPVFLGYEMNSNRLTFKVERIGVDLTFEGVSRDDSLDELEDFLEGQGSDIINDINKLLVAESPVDPLAGNPSSLLGSTVHNAFSTATDTGQKPVNAGAGAGDAKSGGLAGLGARFGKYTYAGNNVTAFTFPFGYSRKTETGKEISFNVPIVYVKTESAESYKIALELSSKLPVTEQWSLTPMIGYGLVGSEDLVSAGQLGSLALTSVYEFNRHTTANGWTFSVANMAGLYKTFPIEISGVEIDPDLSNQVAKNDLIGTRIHTLFNRIATTQIYLTDTRFFGDELYSEQYNEIGVFIKPRYEGSGLGRYFGINSTYLFGEGDVEGFRLSLSYQF